MDTQARFVACGHSRTDIEIYAEDMSIEFGVHQYEFERDGQDGLRKFIEQLGGTIKVAERFYSSPDDASLVVRDQNDFDVLLSAFSGPLRDRYNMAHDLGHYFLHARQGSTTGEFSRGGPKDSLMEWEANWFAASLLMPTRLVMEIWKDNPDTIAIADRFGVAGKVAHYRLYKLGLVGKASEEAQVESEITNLKQRAHR